MVRAWWKNETDEDEHLPHMTDPPQFMTLAELFDRTAVEFYKFDHETFKTNPELAELRQRRGYAYEDEITVSRECLPNYDDLIEHFFTEHLHGFEEVRLVLEGSGYFDVRNAEDKWIRIEIGPDDLIVIPPGVYHRFTLDTKEFIRASRYYVNVPEWGQHLRPADDMECRHKYLERQRTGFKIPGN